MRTENEIKERFNYLVDEIVEEEKLGNTLRVAGLFRIASALRWVLEDSEDKS